MNDAREQTVTCEYCPPVEVRRIRDGNRWIYCCNLCIIERFPNKPFACGICGKKKPATKLVADDDDFLICYECFGEMSEGDGTEETLELYGWDQADINSMTDDEKAEAAEEELAKRNED